MGAVLPYGRMSTALMSSDLQPGWMRTVAEFNPVDWAIEAGRSAVAADPDWSLITGNVALLTALLLGCAALATRAFRSYQASV